MYRTMDQVVGNMEVKEQWGTAWNSYEQLFDSLKLSESSVRQLICESNLCAKCFEVMELSGASKWRWPLSCIWQGQEFCQCKRLQAAQFLELPLVWLLDTTEYTSIHHIDPYWGSSYLQHGATDLGFLSAQVEFNRRTFSDGSSAALWHFITIRKTSNTTVIHSNTTSFDTVCVECIKRYIYIFFF